MRLSQALEGFALYCAAGNVKPHTLQTYQNNLNHLVQYAGDRSIEKVTAQTLQGFFQWLQKEYRPAVNGNHTRRLASSTIRGHWVALRSFYRWASADPLVTGYGLGVPDPTLGIKAPKVNREQVEPFSEDEIRSLLKAIKLRNNKDGKKGAWYLLGLRNRAIILILLDVGLRNSEMRNLRIADVQLSTGRLHVIQGKGEKDRHVYLGKNSRHALWQYLGEREETDIDAWLFPTRTGRQFSNRTFQDVIKEVGKSAGVENCYPHRFRHTCAFLRAQNGETAERLMILLGHSTPGMSLYYVNLARMDVSESQKKNSPVDSLMK